MNKQDNIQSSAGREARNQSLKRHVPLTFLYRFVAAGLGYVIVRLSIDYLDVERYGVWMTLLSILSWVTFFDVGLGNGLRNKLTAALAGNDTAAARSLVTTAYAGIAVIALLFLLLIIAVTPLVSWQKIFNTTAVPEFELSLLVVLVGAFFFFHFFLSLCNYIFFAYQESSLPALTLLLNNLFLAIAVYVLTIVAPGNLLFLGVAFSLSTISAYLIISVYFFSRHREVIPALSAFDARQLRAIMTLGSNFFVIQVAVLIIFATDNLIITQVLGPEHVTAYNVVFRLFNIITVVHAIILAPLWSAFTDAYVQKDIPWIRLVLKRLNLLLVPTVIGVFILIIFARPIISFWIGSDLKITNLLIVLMGAFVIVSAWNNIYAHVINGIGRIKLQAVLAVIGGMINIPLSIYFAKYLGMGNSGVILATIVTLLMSSILIPIQCFSILKQITNRPAECVRTTSASSPTQVMDRP